MSRGDEAAELPCSALLAQLRPQSASLALATRIAPPSLLRHHQSRVSANGHGSAQAVLRWSSPQPRLHPRSVGGLGCCVRVGARVIGRDLMSRGIDLMWRPGVDGRSSCPAAPWRRGCTSLVVALPSPAPGKGNHGFVLSQLNLGVSTRFSRNRERASSAGDNPTGRAVGATWRPKSKRRGSGRIPHHEWIVKDCQFVRKFKSQMRGNQNSENGRRKGSAQATSATEAIQSKGSAETEPHTEHNVAKSGVPTTSQAAE